MSLLNADNCCEFRLQKKQKAARKSASVSINLSCVVGEGATR